MVTFKSTFIKLDKVSWYIILLHYLINVPEFRSNEKPQK